MSKLEDIHRSYLDGDGFDSVRGDHDIGWLLECADTLGKLVEREPLGDDHDRALIWCVYCHETSVPGVPVAHPAECPWQEAREQLSQDGPDTQP